MAAECELISSSETRAYPKEQLTQNYLVKKEVGYPGKEMNAFQHSVAKNPEGRAVPISSTK